LFVSPRDLAQGTSLKSLPSEFQGNYSCPVRAAWLVAFEFISCSNHRFSELTRNLHRFPTFKAGIFRVLAIVSKVFQCIPSNEAVSRRSSSSSKVLNLDLSE
jgi:hypothetical protein